MINASEAKANVKNYICSLIGASLDDINNRIIKASNNGETCAQFPYDEDAYYEVVEKIIKILHDEYGYTVDHNTEWRVLTVKWD